MRWFETFVICEHCIYKLEWTSRAALLLFVVVVVGLVCYVDDLWLWAASEHCIYKWVYSGSRAALLLFAVVVGLLCYMDDLWFCYVDDLWLLAASPPPATGEANSYSVHRRVLRIQPAAKPASASLRDTGFATPWFVARVGFSVCACECVALFLDSIAIEGLLTYVHSPYPYSVYMKSAFSRGRLLLFFHTTSAVRAFVRQDLRAWDRGRMSASCICICTCLYTIYYQNCYLERLLRRVLLSLLWAASLPLRVKICIRVMCALFIFSPRVSVFSYLSFSSRSRRES